MTALARSTDLPSSHEAARVSSQHESAIRSAVERIVRAAGPAGITDRQLTLRYFANPRNPECDFSTPRKRRSDLTHDGEVLVTTSRRKLGNERVAGSVWVHRDFHKETA